MNPTRRCAYCDDYSPKYELCSECYHMAKEEIIIKNETGKWIKNIRKNNEYKFYDETKSYTLKNEILNKYEMRFYKLVKFNISKKYSIIPQVNLQTIIETDSNKRNDELYRNIDFIVYHTKQFTPFLAIELNGKQHYTNEYWKERDKSIKSILKCVQLPLLTIDIQDLKQLTDSEIIKITNKVINYLNPNFLQRIFGKEKNKLDLSWTEKLIKSNQRG